MGEANHIYRRDEYADISWVLFCIIWGERMKICENGIIRDMTAEEIAELEALAAEQPAPEPTAEERIAVLEEALNMLLSGVTE